jgi:hypothetical protein
MRNKARKLLEFRKGRPEGTVVGDRGQARAVDLSHRFPSRAVKSRVFEGFFFGFTGRANGAVVALVVCGLGRKITLARSHLVDAGGLKFA